MSMMSRALSPGYFDVRYACGASWLTCMQHILKFYVSVRSILTSLCDCNLKEKVINIRFKD
jgi:hypothetical protein